MRFANWATAGTAGQGRAIWGERRRRESRFVPKRAEITRNRCDLHVAVAIEHLRHTALCHTELLGECFLVEPGGFQRLMQESHDLTG
ncbi:hypothetical protein EB75_20310 [Mycobacterium sp. ST-F2]|nr:hypothetical protein EB75_20310 [Mycobacterium sp. ST-F2]